MIIIDNHMICGISVIIKDLFLITRYPIIDLLVFKFYRPLIDIPDLWYFC